MNNLEPLTALLIVIATIFFVWLYIWPKFKKDTEVEIKDWKDIFKKILPSFIAKYFNLLFPIVIFLIIIGGLGIFADSQPSGGLFNAVFVSVLLFVCFFGLNKLIKFENPKAGVKQQIPLWGIYGLIVFTIIHNSLNLIITDNMYLVGMISGISILAISWLMTQGPFKILMGGALLCSIFVLQGYVNTGYLPFTNEASWIGYWPVIFIAITTIILFITSHKIIEWYERWSCRIIRLTAFAITILMVPLVFLMMIGKITPDKIAGIVELNRATYDFKERYIATSRAINFVEYTSKEAKNSYERWKKKDPSVTTEDVEITTSNSMQAAKNFYNGAEKIRKNAPKGKSIEALVFSETISLVREYWKEASMLRVRLQI